MRESRQTGLGGAWLGRRSTGQGCRWLAAGIALSANPALTLGLVPDNRGATAAPLLPLPLPPRPSRPRAELLTSPELEPAADGAKPKSWAEVHGTDPLQHPYLYILFLGMDGRGDYVPCRCAGGAGRARRCFGGDGGGSRGASCHGCMQGRHPLGQTAPGISPHDCNDGEGNSSCQGTGRTRVTMTRPLGALSIRSVLCCARVWSCPLQAAARPLQRAAERRAQARTG